MNSPHVRSGKVAGIKMMIKTESQKWKKKLEYFLQSKEYAKKVKIIKSIPEVLLYIKNIP